VKLKISSPSKYVPPHRRLIKGKDNIVYKNANYISAEKVKQHSNKRSLPTCHHCDITGHIRPKCPQLQAQKKKAQRKLPTKTTSGTLPSAGHQVTWHQQNNIGLFRRTHQGTIRKSHKSPIATLLMKGC